MGAASTARFDRKRLIWFGVSFALLGGIVWYLPRVADFPEVWAHIKAMTPASSASSPSWRPGTSSPTGSAWSPPPPASSTGRRWWPPRRPPRCRTPSPGGSAISLGLTYKMLGSWGFSKSQITQSRLVSGIWNNFVKLGMPVLALALLAFSGQVTGSRIVAGAFGIAALVAAVAVFALILRSEEFACRAGEKAGQVVRRPLRLFRRDAAEGWGDATVKFRGRVIGMVRHSWIRLTVVSLVGHLSLFAVLVVALRDVGVVQDEVSWVEILAVFTFVRLLTVVPIMPGSVGIIEVGLISGLSAAGGDHAQIVAAVLVFRALTYVAPIVFGIASYVYWRNNRSWLGSAPPAASFLSAAPTMARLAAR